MIYSFDLWFSKYNTASGRKAALTAIRARTGRHAIITTIIIGKMEIVSLKTMHFSTNFHKNYKY
jgi:hypothetical protein